MQQILFLIAVFFYFLLNRVVFLIDIVTISLGKGFVILYLNFAYKRLKLFFFLLFGDICHPILYVWLGAILGPAAAFFLYYWQLSWGYSFEWKGGNGCVCTCHCHVIVISWNADRFQTVFLPKSSLRWCKKYMKYFSS